MKILSICLLVLFHSSFVNPGSSVEVSDDVITAIRQGNAPGVANYFNDKIDLKILDQEEMYSKGQAELILTDFFSKHKVKSFTPSHSSANKNANQFVVGTLETSDSKFRLSFLIKKGDDKYLISQFRIEKENE